MRRIWKDHRGIIITVLIFCLLIAVAFPMLNSLKSKSLQREEAQLRQSAYRAAAVCYATEGFYPAELSYLKDHYGLHWDESRYILQYDCFASNILPAIEVLPKGDER